jgi:hypothetical protein
MCMTWRVSVNLRRSVAGLITGHMRLGVVECWYFRCWLRSVAECAEHIAQHSAPACHVPGPVHDPVEGLCF